MIHLAREDVLQSLERFRSIAKQDFLASNLTDNPEFWATQAAARRRLDKLIELVKSAGVPAAIEKAVEWYARYLLYTMSRSSVTLSCAVRSKLLRCSSRLLA